MSMWRKIREVFQQHKIRRRSPGTGKAAEDKSQPPPFWESKNWQEYKKDLPKTLDARQLVGLSTELQERILREYDVKSVFNQDDDFYDNPKDHAILFDGAGAVTKILVGDEARAVHYGTEHTDKTIGYLYYESYEFPETAHIGYGNLDLFALLVTHGIIQAEKHEKGDLPDRGMERF